MDPNDLERYSRQVLFPSFGEKGQEKLRASHVLIAGVGGLGSPVAMYLTTSGIGEITLIDSDTVSLSNLNRQLLHWEEDIGREKVFSARTKLTRMNSGIRVHALSEHLTAVSCASYLSGVTCVVDCLDTMASRYALNRACVEARIPLIHGGVYGMIGQLTTILPGRTPCLECIFPRRETPPETVPVFGPTAGFIASLQALEVIKLIAGVGENLLGRFLYFNGETMECFVTEFHRRGDCPVCRSL